MWEVNYLDFMSVGFNVTCMQPQLPVKELYEMYLEKKKKASLMRYVSTVLGRK